MSLQLLCWLVFPLLNHNMNSAIAVAARLAALSVTKLGTELAFTSDDVQDIVARGAKRTMIDTILFNGNIITLDDKYPRVSALAITMGGFLLLVVMMIFEPC